MTRFAASISLLVVLCGCSGAKPEDKPVAKTDAKAGADVEAKQLAEARAAADAKAKASPAVLEAKALEAKALEEARAAAPSAAVGAPPAAAPQGGPALEVFEGKDGRSGYRTAAGEVVIPATYGVAMPFDGAVASVATDEGWIFIDRTGKKLASAFVFDNAADYFVDGRARIVDGEKHGFIASTGEIIVPPSWSFAGPFSGGYAAVCEGCKREPLGEHYSMTGGKWGYIDVTGKLVIPPRFSQAGPFEDGRAMVSEGGRDFAIGPDGAEQK